MTSCGQNDLNISSSDESEWEGSETSPSTAPPPVIFAGVSSPGRFHLPSKGHPSGQHCQTQVSKQFFKRLSLKRVNDESSSSHTQDVPSISSSSSSMALQDLTVTRRNSNSLTPTLSAMPRRPSISSCSAVLVSSCRAEMQRRTRRGARLRNQIAELEAALDHSRAKEAVLLQNLTDMKEEIIQKNQKLSERQKIIETLEQEHRQVKSSFRELMDATLDSSGLNSPDVEMIGEEVAESATVCRSLAYEGVGAIITDGKIEPTHTSAMAICNLATPEPTSREFIDQGTSGLSINIRHQKITRRARSVPPAKNRNDQAVHQQDLRSRLRETEELLETLRGTNGYAQQVLKRNSVLEKRCDELERLRDAQLRDAYNELQRCRVEQADAATAAERYKAEATDGRQQIASLHAQLQRLHENGRCHQNLSLELTETKEALAVVREALEAQIAENTREAAEWGAERQHLQKNLELQQRLLIARGDGLPDDSSELRERNTELEELLTTQRKASNRKIQEQESKIQCLNGQLRAVMGKLDVAERALENEKTRGDDLDSSKKRLIQSSNSLQSEVDRMRDENARLNLKAAEIEELRRQLKSERERSASLNAQVARHLEAIKESNQRFGELVERNNILDKLLQKQQKEKENLVAENMRTNGKLYSQVDNYRKKWEVTTAEISVFKKQLSEQTERIRVAVEQVETSKNRELRQLRDEFAGQRLAMHRSADSEMTKLRQQHAQELTELRKLKDDKLESVIKQYESYLSELKSSHERHVKDLHGGLDKDASRAKEEINQRITDATTIWKEQLNEERLRHEKEIQTLTKSYQDNLQSELKKKAEELDKLRRTLYSQKEEMERFVFLLERRLEDERLQKEELAASLETKANSAANAASLEEKERGRAAISAAQSECSKAIKTLEEAHAQVVQALNRKLSVLNEKLSGAITENEKLVETIVSRDTALSNTRSDVSKAIESLEIERKKNVAAALKEQEELRSQLAEARQTISELRDKVDNNEEVERLNERLQTLLFNNTELEKRLKNEVEALTSQLDAKEERLQTLLTASQHTQSILKRNSELEETAEKEKKEISVTLQQEHARVIILESELAKVRDESNKSIIEKNRLILELEECRRANESLEKRIHDTNQRLENHLCLEEKVKQLSDANVDLLRQLPSQNDLDSDTESTKRYHERLRELNTALNEAKMKGERLETELLAMKNAAEETSKITLDLQHMKSKVESQDHLLDLLRQRASKKDEIIEDLKQQVNQLLQNFNQELPDSSSAQEKKLMELAKRCQDLSDLQQTFEMERRSLEHRMELDRQLWTQTSDQKDRQLELLMETNKRAELCFARNVELEEVLFKLTNELETLRVEQLRKSAVEDMTTSTFVHTSDHNEPVRDSKTVLRQELDSLRGEIMQKEGENRLLQNRLNETRSRYQKEIEELSSRLKLASLEQSLTGSNNSGDDLLQSLIDKVTQLKEEVKRLKKGQDAKLIALQAENESLREATTTPGTSGRDFMEGNSRTSVLQSQLETLEIERDALRIRVTELVETLRSSVELSDVEELRQRNKDLETTVDKLSAVVAEQKQTLDGLNKRADEALKQNLSLKKLTKQLELEIDDDYVLEHIVKRNLELEALLRDLQQNETEDRLRISRKSTTATIASASSHISECISSSNFEQLKEVNTHAHRHSLSPVTASCSITCSDAKENKTVSSKAPSPPFTPSTTVGDSRCSPASSMLGQDGDAHSTLCNEPYSTEKYDNVTSNRLPFQCVSLYRIAQSSMERDNSLDDEDEEGRRGRNKRPRTSQHEKTTPIPSTSYTITTRSKTQSLPPNNENESYVIDHLS